MYSTGSITYVCIYIYISIYDTVTHQIISLSASSNYSIMPYRVNRFGYYCLINLYL